MKKLLSVLLIVALLSGLVWSGYQQYHNIWYALLMIPECIVFGGIGGLIAIFIMENLFKKTK